MVLFMIACGLISAQTGEVPVTAEQQLEGIAEKNEAGTEDDSQWQDLQGYRRHPLNINTATEEELRSLGRLSDLQIDGLVRYRQLLGKLLAMQELQSVPAWDVETIRQLTPYITVTDPAESWTGLRHPWKGGDRVFLFRASIQPEKPEGYRDNKDSATTGYTGSPLRFFFRFSYQYKNLLQYGMLGDKDAGEQFFRGGQRQGFDFYSFHFFMRRPGLIRALALGDFTVNMGPGLIQWQRLAFGKGAELLSVKRQGSLLKPYRSPGEYNFHRGLGLQLQTGHWNAGGFVSMRKLSAHLTQGNTDQDLVISSFSESGLHRTIHENEERNNTSQLCLGAHAGYAAAGRQMGFNFIQYYFSAPIQKQPEPYNLFAMHGRSWSNYSVDYNYTFRNLHFFGELAMDKFLHRALINGLLVSLGPSVDAALLFRSISSAYRAVNADAFTENSDACNERGLYAGITMRPAAGWRLHAYFDLFQFPWLRFRADAPGYGKEYFLQLIYQPAKSWSLYVRYKYELKAINAGAAAEVMRAPVMVPRVNLRTGLTLNPGRAITIGSRVDMVWYNGHSGEAEEGFAGFFEFSYKSPRKPYGLNLRLAYTETGGYNSRIYAFEKDVLFSYSMPAMYDKMFRYYINLHSRVGHFSSRKGHHAPFG